MAVILPAPIDSPCETQKECNALGRCIKNTEKESLAKNPVNWLSVAQRVRWIGAVIPPEYLQVPNAKGAFGFAPPQFNPNIFKEGEWLCSTGTITPTA